jgi:hypothetical protein
MKPGQSQKARRLAARLASLLLLQAALVPDAGTYVLNYVVADVRQPDAVSGNTACPQRMRIAPFFSGIAGRFWATILGTNPVTIRTLNQTSDARLNEIESSVERAFTAWIEVTGNTFANSAPLPLQRFGAIQGCEPDGWLAVCFLQTDPAFTFGVLAFTRVVAVDTIGALLNDEVPSSSFPGQILDADILLRPADPSVRFATPEALPSNPTAYDLESVLTHEMGHVFGLGHSGVWRAMMFPFVPSPGTFLGSRPTELSPDAALAEDDRAAIRALYPDPFDLLHTGSIRGRVLPANPLTLAGDPAGPTGILGAQVVALDETTGAVIAAAVSGWSCADPGPPVFDGAYHIERLAVGSGQAYLLYAEPLDGPVTASDAFGQVTLCRNPLSDPGWPPPLACVTPQTFAGFSTKIRPSP